MVSARLILILTNPAWPSVRPQFYMNQSQAIAWLFCDRDPVPVFVLDRVLLNVYSQYISRNERDVEMTQTIHSRRVISISEFRKNPIECVKSGEGALAIMSRNQPEFYCLSADEFAELVELAEKARKAQAS